MYVAYIQKKNDYMDINVPHIYLNALNAHEHTYDRSHKKIAYEHFVSTCSKNESVPGVVF